ncbi:MAG TPA: hypothetical protein VFA70_07750, partial [Dehalococcoidia bacterium]|nr:hypothetical protein [Dehalococcoidia bacterium]
MVAALAVALLLVPVVLAVAAPALAAVPVVTAPPAPRYPLPAPASGVPAHLDGLFDSFPLVATDLPDDQSRQAVADFQQARIDQPETMVRMYVDAWKGISDTIGQSDVNDKIVPLVEQLNQGTDFGGPGSDSAKKLAALWTPSLPALTADPRNADRLNNVAVGLIGLSVALGEGAQNSSVNVNSYHSTEPGYDSWQFGYGPGLGAAGLWLLQAVAQAFPANRAVLLNLAYFTSVAPPAPDTVPVQAAIPFAQRWLSASPDDATARLLLGSLQSRQTDTPVALDQATATLAPLAQSPVTQSLGHAALGDAALA